jgi:glutathione synthase
MSLKIAVQMDHISTVNIAGDTTFALSLEAQARGHQLFHLTPDRLSLDNGKVVASLEPMQVRDVKGDHFTLGETILTDVLCDDHAFIAAYSPQNSGGQ